MAMKFATDPVAGSQRARAPGWMYFVAGTFITYYVVMCYSELYEPRRIGIDGEFKDGAMGITRVVQRSPAARAGIQAGDRLLAIDESGIRDWEDWRRFVATVETGRDYRFELERAGQRSEFSVKPGRQPGDPFARPEHKRFVQFFVLLLALVLAFPRPHERVAQGTLTESEFVWFFVSTDYRLFALGCFVAFPVSLAYALVRHRVLDISTSLRC